MVQSVLSLNFYSKYLGLDFHIQQPGDGIKCSTSAGLILNDLHINTISVTGPVINHVGVGGVVKPTLTYSTGWMHVIRINALQRCSTQQICSN